MTRPGERDVRSRLVVWVVRAAVPARWRTEWADDLALTIHERQREARSHGPWALTGFWTRELGSLLWMAARWRLRAPSQADGRYVMYEEDKRPYRVAWMIALAVHFLAFTVVFPFAESSLQAEPGREVIVIRRLPPPPRKRVVKQQVVKKRVPPVPIPDPTPDDPEPIVEDVEIVIEVRETPDVEVWVAPPAEGPPAEQAPAGPVRVGGDVVRPALLVRVEPEYPELALRARLQCVVILEAKIDTVGAVTDLQVLRGCGMGLDEAARRAVGQWRYAPTTLNGRPVEVVLTVTVRFELS